MDSKIVQFDCLKNCRVCLHDTSELYSLFDSKGFQSYHTMLMECTNITVDENDGLPKVICRICVNEMLEAHKFVIKCQQNDKQLRLSLINLVGDIKEIKVYKQVLDEITVKEEPMVYHDFDDRDEYKEDLTNSDMEFKPKYLSKKRKTKKSVKSRRNYVHSKSFNFPRKCTECDVILRCESAMIIHMRKHTNERPFQCADCGKCYKNKSSLKSHCFRRHSANSNVKSSGKNFTCATCNKRFFHKKDMLIHIRIHTGETPYHCKFCPKAFTQISSLIRHTRIHTGERPYECKICHKRFPSSSEMHTHNRVHSDERKYVCPVCNIFFKSKNALKIHGMIHENLREFVCDKCGMSFNKKGNLKSHVDRMHSERAGQCCVCNKKFSKLDDHMRIHTGETPFECDLCNKKFSLKSRLLSHITYHKVLDRHACQVEGCTKKFPKHSMLVFHTLKYHKKQTPYICVHCNRGFYRLSDLRRHLKLNHSDQPNILEDIKNADSIKQGNVA